jgi:hypothetical protein
LIGPLPILAESFMHRNQTIRRQAFAAAKELIDSLDLPPDEAHFVLALAIDRYESVRRTMEEIGAGKGCLSAVFAAALEYSETLAGE